MLRIVGAGLLLVGRLNEQGPAMDIPKVSQRPGQNVFKPKVHQT